MAKEIITLTDDGVIGTEMIGFKGKSCLKAAADISIELEKLGIVSNLQGIRMKNTANPLNNAQRMALKIEEE